MDRQPGLTWDVVDGYSEDHQQNPPPAAAAGRGGSVPGSGEWRGGVRQAAPHSLPPLVGLPVLTFVWGYRKRAGSAEETDGQLGISCPPSPKDKAERGRNTDPSKDEGGCVGPLLCFSLGWGVSPSDLQSPRVRDTTGKAGVHSCILLLITPLQCPHLAGMSSEA